MITMTLEEAKASLAEWIDHKGGLQNSGVYISWSQSYNSGLVTLDGEFDAETLLAIAVYMMEYKP